MFLDVTLYGEGIFDDAYDVLESWREEHGDYYGLPHGQTTISRQYGGFGFGTLSPDGGVWLTCGLNYHALQIIENRDGIERVRLTYCGRRHGMRSEFVWFLQKYWNSTLTIGGNTFYERRLHAYVTQEPGWLPWETLDSHRVKAGSVSADA